MTPGVKGLILQFIHLLRHHFSFDWKNPHISLTITTNDNKTFYGCAMCGDGKEIADLYDRGIK